MSFAFFPPLPLICERCCNSIKIWIIPKSMLLHIFKWKTKFIKRNEFAEQNIRLRRFDVMFWLFSFIVYLWRGVHISLENSCATRQLASHTLYFIFVCSPLFVWISLRFSVQFRCLYSKTSKRHGMHPIIRTTTATTKDGNTYKTFVCLFWSFLQVVTIENVWMESKLP